MKDRPKKYEKRKNMIFAFVLLLLMISTVYAFYMFLNAPSGIAHSEHERVKSDYVLMLLECVVGSIIIFLPSRVEHLFHIDIPDLMEIIYFIFLFCAIYLGEVQDFYYKIPYWDSILHCFSAVMLGALGFMIVNVLNSSDKINIQLSPFFVALFAFSFALTCGTLWEFYEFGADGLLGTNMQKFINAKGIILVGREALSDTMEDLIVDGLGALTISMIGYFDLRKKHIPSEPS